jgi:hypothetical protein
MRQGDPVFYIAHGETGAALHLLAPVARISHAPVESNAVAVDAMASLVKRFPDFSPGAAALGRSAISDLGGHGDRPTATCFANLRPSSINARASEREA